MSEAMKLHDLFEIGHNQVYHFGVGRECAEWGDMPDDFNPEDD